MKYYIKAILFSILIVIPCYSQYFHVSSKLKKYNFEEPLLRAIKNSNYNNVKSLIKSRIDINKETTIYISTKIPDFNKEVKIPLKINPLFLSVIINDYQITKLLLNNNVKISNDLLLFSIADIKSVKLLIRHGANVNKQDNSGRTCLHYSVISGDKEKFLEFLKSGGNINQIDNDGWTTLGLAHKHKKKELIKIIASSKIYTNIDKAAPKTIQRKNIIFDKAVFGKKSIKNPNSLLKGLRASPYRLNGKIFGLNLLTIRSYNLLYQFGFRDGDIITKINGKKLDYDNLYLNFPNTLFENKKVTFEFFRFNKLYRLNVEIKEN